MLESLRRNWELDILQQQLFSPFFPFAHFLLGDPMAARWQWQWRGQWQGSGGWGATGLGSWCHLLRKVCFPITPFQMRFSSLLLHSAFLSNPTVVIQLARRDLLRSICSPHPLKSTKSLSLSAFLLSRVSCTNGKQNSLTPWIPRDVGLRPLVARLNTALGPRRIWRPQPSPLGWLIALMTGRAVNQPADIVGFTWTRPPLPPRLQSNGLLEKSRYARNLQLWHPAIQGMRSGPLPISEQPRTAICCQHLDLQVGFDLNY